MELKRGDIKGLEGVDNRIEYINKYLKYSRRCGEGRVAADF